LNRPQNPDHLPVVDLLRSLSILIVMAGHFKGFPRPVRGGEFWDLLHINCAYGVTVFFVVSGFLITRLLDLQPGGMFHPSYGAFYVRRVARLFPLLGSMILLGILFTFFIKDPSPIHLYCFHTLEGWFDASFWASILLFVYNWYEALVPANIPGLYWGLLWSLAVEEQFYLFYPAALRWWGGNRRWAIGLGVLMVVGPGWRGWCSLTGLFRPGEILITTLGSIDAIATGCLLYGTWKTLGDAIDRRPILKSLFLFGGAVLMIVTLFMTRLPSGRDVVFAPTCMELGAFLFVLGGLGNPIFNNTICRPFLWPGKFSYGLYLFHTLIFYLLFPWLLRFEMNTAFCFFVIIATLVLGSVHRFFEVPANHWVRRRFS
jgi:peptidoglycan/LPS O-acetylase OafA/YrhL